jgi:predicted  nucleic acid-binding Zn-ribbon protein
MASALTNAITNWFAKLARSRIVLEHPDDPEDERVLHLFKNRAEMKKALSDAQDESHRLKDRIKLQESATSRVREQLEQLEARLAAPLSGLHSLTHYQLRDLWATGHAQVGKLLREQAQQREERERRQFLAELNRQLFERSQQARANCAQAEHAAVDVRGRLSALQAQLANSQRWWQYFTRRDLSRRLQTVQGEAAIADAQLQQAREQLLEIEEQGGAKYPGLSLEARRMLNLTAIACAQLQALRLAPQSLLARCVEAMSRSEPRVEGAGDAAAALALMQEVARARAAMIQAAATMQPDVRRLADHLAAHVRYLGEGDTLPRDESVQSALRSGLGRGEQMSWNLLGEDLWSLSDLFYGVEE